MKISKKTTELNRKKTSFYDKLTISISTAIRGIEIFLSCLLIICVVISSIYLIAHFIKDVTLINTLVDYDTLQHFLSYLLLLIIALELAMMLIKHTPNNVVDVTIYAIARKMLIYNTSSSDMLLGVITLSILFFCKAFSNKRDFNAKRSR